MIIGGKKVGIQPAGNVKKMQIEKKDTIAVLALEPILVGFLSSFVAYFLINAAKKTAGGNNDDNNGTALGLVGVAAAAATEDIAKDYIKENVSPHISRAVHTVGTHIRSAYELQAEMDFNLNIKPIIKSKL